MLFEGQYGWHELSVQGYVMWNTGLTQHNWRPRLSSQNLHCLKVRQLKSALRTSAHSASVALYNSYIELGHILACPSSCIFLTVSRFWSICQKRMWYPVRFFGVAPYISCVPQTNATVQLADWVMIMLCSISKDYCACTVCINQAGLHSDELRTQGYLIGPNHVRLV